MYDQVFHWHRVDLADVFPRVSLRNVADQKVQGLLVNPVPKKGRKLQCFVAVAYAVMLPF